MANRFAPYKVRTLTREPRRLYVKFQSTGADGAQTLLNSGPFNDGIVNVVASATGLYKISLGSSATQRDTYSYFAGASMVCNATDEIIDYVYNSQCNHATDPNITLQVSDTDAVAGYIANTATAVITLDFLDSKD